MRKELLIKKIIELLIENEIIEDYHVFLAGKAVQVKIGNDDFFNISVINETVNKSFVKVVR